MTAFPKSKTFPTLYGMSSKGVVKIWKIWAQEFAVNSAILTEHGQEGGKMQLATEVIREGKNIGKANETSHFEQACLEAESKWNKKHDANYTEDKTLILGDKIAVAEANKKKLLPMLAQKYKERAHHLVWPAWAQPKLDGVRCLVERKGGKIIFRSRKAKIYKNFNLYMEDEFLGFLKDGEILDGEMYNHGDLTFQELVSLVKDEKTPDLDTLKRYVKFWCYDRPRGNAGFEERYVNWDVNVNHLQYIRTVDTIRVHNDAEVNERHGQFVGDGFEGTIIRSGGDEPYVFQYRANQLQKKKDFIDEEFVIVGCKQGSGSAEGHATFRCQTEFAVGGSYNDGSFDVTCKTTHKKRKEQWENHKKYIGKELTVRFFCRTDAGIPKWPVGIVPRDYE
jgi:DNA ligase-1